ncbi:GntR family transcriptional regulator [Streptomyces sp. CA-210063]|uniref:GntR family transcriptional regulator n=1 Tax=Streptomyces sp. CA-210063 TaxID=2801029 RepID=UPI00214B81F1|nr:GntR family transcriptional regulator [Streptomyces sp. CA-210063]UUU31983.1 GntR family transcriptional regulator [Streptomyces sp. CA-210063]
MSDTTTPTAPSAAGATRRELGERYADILRGEIRDGTWGPDRILRRADLADRFGVSPEVVIRAVRQLVREGLVETRGAVGARPTVEGRSWTPPQGGTQLQHIEDVLRSRIADGTYQSGERLPSLRELGREFEVSHSMIASALKPLRSEGLVVIESAGTGFYVPMIQPTGVVPQRRPLGRRRGSTMPRREDTVRAVIVARILAGAYPAGQRLPKRRELAAELGAGLETVRDALDPLVHNGTLYVLHGRGTFVARQGEPTPLDGANAVNATAETIRTRLKDGTYPAGTRLPDQRALAAELGVGLHTLTAVYKTLVDAGLLVTVFGGGTFAVEPGAPRPRSYQTPDRRGGQRTWAAPIPGTTHVGRVRDTVLARIGDRTYSPGTRITAVTLAGQLGVSYDTVRNALAPLVAEGRLRSRRGRGQGYFVTGSGPAPPRPELSVFPLPASGTASTPPGHEITAHRRTVTDLDLRREFATT